MTVTREELYAQVWVDPMTKVAARHGVTSTYMARVCADLKVPRPPRGYWAKLKVGRAPKQPPLPAAEPGHLLEWARGAERRDVRRAPPVALGTKARRKKALAATRPAMHPLVVGARAHFDKGRTGRDDYLRPNKKILVDVFVSKGTVDSVLATASEIFLDFEERGYRVMFAPGDERHLRPDIESTGGNRVHNAWRPYQPTVVFIGIVAFGLTFYEISEEVEVEWVKGEYRRVAPLLARLRSTPRFGLQSYKKAFPSGRLALRAYSTDPTAPWEQQWKETEAGTLRKKFNAIKRALEEAAPTIATQAEEARKQADIEHAKWELEHQRREGEEAERRCKQAHVTSGEQLLSIIERWALACRVEDFFATLESEIAQISESEREAFTNRWKVARQMFGGRSAVPHFQDWHTPDEHLDAIKRQRPW